MDILNEVMDTLRFFLLLYVLFAEKLTYDKRRLELIVITYIVIFVGLICANLESELYRLGTLTQIAMVALLLRERWYEKILTFLMLFSLPSVAELALEIICRYIVGTEPFQGTLDAGYGMSGRILSLLLIALFACIGKKTRSKLFVSNMSKLLLFIICFSFSFTLVWITNGKYQMDHVGTLLMSVCCIIIEIINVWILIIDSSRKKQAVNAERTEQYLSYIERLELEHTEIRKIHHDMKKHLNALNILADDNDAKRIKEYIRSIETDLAERYEDVHYTDNRLFNAILADEKKRAETAGIDIRFKGALCADIGVSDCDFTIIITNLLDNAREYVSQNGFKTIEARVCQEQSSIVIRVANPIKDEAEIQIGKSGKNNSALHGFGLMNVKRAAEKYNGLLELNAENGKFTAKVLLMN